MKTLENEWLKAYKFTIFEILRDFFCIIVYCMLVLSLHKGLPNVIFTLSTKELYFVSSHSNKIIAHKVLPLLEIVHIFPVGEM